MSHIWIQFLMLQFLFIDLFFYKKHSVRLGIYKGKLHDMIFTVILFYHLFGGLCHMECFLIEDGTDSSFKHLKQP